MAIEAIKRSILTGVNDLIDHALGIADNTRYGIGGNPSFFSRQAVIDLSEQNKTAAKSDLTAQVSAVIPKILDRIQANWNEQGSRSPSSEVWKLRKALHLDHQNPSSEKVLEKMIVRLLDAWFNQIPTCSGMSECGERHRSIDLAHDCGGGNFELIELKYGTAEQGFGSEHPLYAAMEILQYGLLFFHAKRNGLSADADLIQRANEIRLMVLAPAGYYQYKCDGSTKRFELAWLERAINDGLDALDLPLPVQFQFQQFTSDFDSIYSQPQPLAEGVRSFQHSELKTREAVYR